MARKILFFVLASCLFVLPAFAQTQLPLKTHASEVGAETYYMKYEDPGLMKNEGWMYGVIGSYTYHNGVMARRNTIWMTDMVPGHPSASKRDMTD